MDKRRKVYRLNVNRADALTLYRALNNVTSSQAGSYDKFHSIAELAESIGDYFAFTPEDEAEAEQAEAQSSQCVSTLYGRRSVFLYE